VLLILVALFFGASAETYQRIKTVNLSVAGTIGGHGDWVAYDCETDTVWLSHSPDSNVVVVDAKTNDIRVIIPSVLSGDGIAFGPSFAFVADYQSSTVNVYDKRNYALLQVLSTPGGPDGVYYSQSAGLWVALDDVSRILKFSQNSNSHQQPFKPQPTANISLSTPVTSGSVGPDVGVLVGNYLFQPIDNVINVIDVYQAAIVHVWNLNITGTAKGISYDDISRNLVVGTNQQKAFIISATSGAVVATIPLPGAVDESVVLSDVRRAYIGDKSGSVDVIDLNRYTLLQSFSTAPSAHTLTAATRPNGIYVWSYLDQTNLLAVYQWVP